MEIGSEPKELASSLKEMALKKSGRFVFKELTQV